jgi:hypothetical protein
MKKEMTLHECVLDALADDSESIVQIEGYFKHTSYSVTQKEVKNIIIDLLQKEMIFIVEPPDKTINDFINSDEETITDFWFDRTKKGVDIWKGIDFDEDEDD